MSIQTFTRALPAPDPATLRTAVTAILGAAFTAFPEAAADGSFVVRIDKPTAWAPGDVTAVQNAITSAAAASPALSQQADVDGMPIWAKALALALIDQLNVIRAALPAPLPAITVNQAITAIRNKAGTL